MNNFAPWLIVLFIVAAIIVAALIVHIVYTYRWEILGILIVIGVLIKREVVLQKYGSSAPSGGLLDRGASTRGFNRSAR